MRALVILAVLLRIGVLAMVIAGRVRIGQLARYNGQALWAIVRICDAIIWFCAWLLVVVLDARVGFLPAGPAWFFREFAVCAWLPLGLAFGRLLYVTSRRHYQVR